MSTSGDQKTQLFYDTNTQFDKSMSSYWSMAKMESIKAIETMYNGYRFRSRLEARWAVFFDTLKVRWQYEPEGFQLPSGNRYLPDFYLTDLDLWIEIKPGDAPQYWGRDAMPLSAEWTRPLELAYEFAHSSGNDIAILYGTPHYMPHTWEYGEQKLSYVAMYFWGGFDKRAAFEYGLEHYFVGTLGEFLRGKGFDAPDFDYTMKTADALMNMDRQYYAATYGKEHPKWRYGVVDTSFRWDIIDGILRLVWVSGEPYTPHNDVRQALEAGATARFEHGEKPKSDFSAWLGDFSDITF